MEKRSGNTQYVMERSISDHCSIVLKVTNYDWGPKPFRALDCWFMEHGFKEKVAWMWNSYEVQGRGAYVLKEKIKLLKKDLKQWNKESFGNLQKQSKDLVAKINLLDLKGEHGSLLQEEMDSRRFYVGEYWKIARRNESLLPQKSRSRWIKEGDGNTKFFRGVINWKRRKNNIKGISIKGRWEEEPRLVKKEVLEFYQKIFYQEAWMKP